MMGVKENQMGYKVGIALKNAIRVLLTGRLKRDDVLAVKVDQVIGIQSSLERTMLPEMRRARSRKWISLKSPTQRFVRPKLAESICRSCEACTPGNESGDRPFRREVSGGGWVGGGAVGEC